MDLEELAKMESRALAATKGPWQAFVEGRDFSGGSDIIRMGGLDGSVPDMYVSHEAKPAPAADLDFIAHARQDIPSLVSEVRRQHERIMVLAHKRSIYHRPEIEKSATCGCFHCMVTFSPKSISQWTDDHSTALCPECGIDAVIGDASGVPLTNDLLNQMHARWFEETA